MKEITLNFDKKANDSIEKLMKHYQLNSEADLISKALRFLSICAHVDKTNGQLIARKEGKESLLVF